MLPSIEKYGPWPNGGEIDIKENVGFEAHIVHAAVHTRSYNHIIGTQKTAEIEVPTVSTEFNVYAVEWTSEEIRGYVNQQQFFTFKNERLNQPRG